MTTSHRLNWIVALIGVWEILAPFIFGYNLITVALWNAIIVGLILLVLGVWAAITNSPATERILDWINVVVGVWLIIAPFILGYAYVANRAAMWNPIIVGAAVVILELWGVFEIRAPVGPPGGPGNPMGPGPNGPDDLR